MADQICDKRSVGIPEDIVIVRAEIEELHDETVASSRSAHESEVLAQLHASDARDAAEESRAWAEVRHLGVHFSDTPPDEVVDGMTWFMTNEETSQITAIRRYDSSSMKQCIFPTLTTYPSSTLYMHEVGEWQDFSLAPSLVA